MYEGAVQDLIDELGRLPGVGPKSAQRIAFHLLQADSDDVTRLVTALTEVKARVRFCEECGNVAEAEKCRICADPRRDQTAICVVEEPKDVVAIERTREFRGNYHVLGGAISPIDGIGPDDLRVRELMTRLASGEVQEVIIATDPNLEGEATADLPQPAAARRRPHGDAARLGPARRRRPRVRRRGDPRTRLRGPPPRRRLTRPRAPARRPARRVAAPSSRRGWRTDARSTGRVRAVAGWVRPRRDRAARHTACWDHD